MVLVAAVVALLALSKVGEDVMEGETTAFDAVVQAWMLHHQSPPLATFFLWVTRLGGVTGMLILTACAGVFLWRREQRRVVPIIIVMPLVAVGCFSLAKSIYARPRPAGLGGVVPSSYAFPSGHATASAAICCTLAYVFWRERYVSGAVAVLFAIVIPLLIGFSRLYLNVHWATDVLGGWSGGALVAVLSAVLYKRLQQRMLREPDVSPSAPRPAQ